MSSSWVHSPLTSLLKAGQGVTIGSIIKMPWDSNDNETIRGLSAALLWLNIPTGGGCIDAPRNYLWGQYLPRQMPSNSKPWLPQHAKDEDPPHLGFLCKCFFILFLDYHHWSGGWMSTQGLVGYGSDSDSDDYKNYPCCLSAWHSVISVGIGGLDTPAIARHFTAAVYRSLRGWWIKHGSQDITITGAIHNVFPSVW